MAVYNQLPGALDLKFTQGNYLSATMTFTQDGTPVDFTTYTFVSAIFSEIDGETVKALTVTVLDAINGKLSISLSAADSANVAAGNYRWYLRWNSGATSPLTVVSGMVYVE